MQRFQKSDSSSLSKPELHELADGLLLEDAVVLERCIDFVCAETVGLWHGRARALMCRRLKHIALSKKQSAQLVQCISNRFSTGEFSEQFKDQLRLALLLDLDLLLKDAEKCQTSHIPHVCRYATWVLRHVS